MPNARGVLSNLFLREQATFGTAEATGQTAKWIRAPYYSMRITPTLERRPSVLIDGSGALPSELIDGLESVTWQVELPVRTASLGWWLKMFTGTPITAGSSPDFTHTFRAVANPTIPAFSIGLDSTDITVRVRMQDCYVTDIAVRGLKDGDRARVQISGIASRARKVTGAFDSAPIVPATDVSFMNYVGRAVRDGTNLSAAVIGLDMNFRNGLALDQELMNGQAYAGDVLPALFSFEGAIRLRFQDATWIDDAEAGTLMDLQVQYGSGNQYVRFQADAAKLSLATPPIDGQGYITQEYSWQVGTLASGKFCQIVLANQTANYTRA